MEFRSVLFRSGAFKTVSLSEGGDERIIGFHLPGELMGLDALADGEHRCEAVALDPAEVCEVPVDELSAIASQLPGLQRQRMRVRSEEHTSELQSLMRISYAVFCLKKKIQHDKKTLYTD